MWGTSEEARTGDIMGIYKYLQKAYKNPKAAFGKEAWKNKLVELRQQPVFVRLDKPTRIDRARALGYKAKQGFVIVRVRILGGGRSRPAFKGGRRPKRYAMRNLTPGKSIHRMAEERVAKKYINLEVLNSYWLASDSRYHWYECILVDPQSPVIKADPTMKWICNSKRRVFRGLTSAGKRGRGLNYKGKRATKNRPSIRAKGRGGK